MKLFCLLGVVPLLASLSAAWSKEDREIFRIRDEILAYEADPAATFYDILGIPPSASLDDINKAYRQKTRSLHPDKVKQQLKNDRVKASKKNKGGARVKAPTAAETRAAVKMASERQARLSLIANILRGPLRDRYDHFVANGFPLWKGTDYYYQRYRPGLGTVIVGLFITGGGAIHYLVLYMAWKRQKEFVERYVRFARDAAWGSNFGIPNIDTAPSLPADSPADDESGPSQPMNRKQRRLQEKESKKEEARGRSRKVGRKTQDASPDASSGTRPTGALKRVVAENGKILVVDSVGDVFLEEEDEDGNVNEYLLDPAELHQPTMKDTAAFRIPRWAYRSVLGRFSKDTSTASDADNNDAPEDSDAPQRTPSTGSASEEFELLDKSTVSLGKVKASGAQHEGKQTKRKARKR